MKNPLHSMKLNISGITLYLYLRLRHRNSLILLLLLSSPITAINSAYANEDKDKVKEDECTPLQNFFEKRVCTEKLLRHQPFVLIPYKPNYFIYSWSDNLNSQNPLLKNHEAKFQISFKVPINEHHDDTRWLWFLGYTQLSVWQMVNSDHSSPFRDTNFEPELMLTRLSNAKFLGWNIRLINFGLINHQSNGKSPPDSRSWNRSYVDFLIERDSYYISLKKWYRWKEEQKTTPTDFVGDDNPDIEDYVGHGELKFIHAGALNNITLSLRDINNSNRLASYQLDWSYPVGSRRGLRFYLQYFNGYGETLIDYNIKRERFGMGIMLTDWL